MMTPAAASASIQPDAFPTVTDALLMRIRGDFLEMPCLRLTLRQAMRLWALDAVSCDVALRTLIEDGFLRRTRQGAFVRR